MKNSHNQWLWFNLQDNCRFEWMARYRTIRDLPILLIFWTIILHRRLLAINFVFFALFDLLSLKVFIFPHFLCSILAFALSLYFIIIAALACSLQYYQLLPSFYSICAIFAPSTFRHCRHFVPSLTTYWIFCLLSFINCLHWVATRISKIR